MFYEDYDNIQILELGSGDTLLCSGVIKNEPSLGALSIIDNCGICHNIDERHDHSAESDIDLNTVMRIVFKDTRSIDVLIRKLETIKEIMNPDFLKKEFYCEQREEYITYEDCAKFQVSDMVSICASCDLENKTLIWHVFKNTDRDNLDQYRKG